MKEEKILVTGGSGMVGIALQKLIPGAIFLSSKHGDLRNYEQCKEIFDYYLPDYVIHLAAKVGGIKANQEHMAEFFYDNVAMNINVLENARRNKVKKLLSLLSTCVFPDKVKYPLTEEQLCSGFPNLSNYGYAYAKRMLYVQSKSYREQYGVNYICAIPNNVFGLSDQFDLNKSHVIPGIIRKIYAAKLDKKNVVELWSPSAIREFTCSNDIAKAILFLMENYDGEMPINIGNTEEYTIGEVAVLISLFLGYRGEIKWNNSNSGQLKKPSSNKKFLQMGWKKEWYSEFEQSLEEVCKWYIQNYPNVRL